MTSKTSPSSLLWLLIAVLVGIPAGCASPGIEASDPQQPNEIRVASHEPDSCALCDLYAKDRRYVVLVSTPNGQGAGVVLSSDGIAATNAHVVGESQQVMIRTSEGQTLTGKVIAASPADDLALIHIDSNEVWFPPSIEGGSYPPVGSEVYVVGHPIGLGWTVTRGIVSSYREFDGRPMIQTDAPISPGNSGGPLLDGHGHLIGIVTAKVRGFGAENIGFARPASALLDFMAREGFYTKLDSR